MKLCKNCQTENPAENLFCTACGLSLETEDEIVEPAVVEEEEFELETPAEPEQKKSPVGLIVILVLAVLLVVAVIFGKGQYDKKKAEEAAALAAQQAAEQEAAQQEAEEAPSLSANSQPGHHVNAHGYNSHSIHYTVDESGVMTFDYQDKDGNTVTLTEAEVNALLDETVATAAGQTLTNRNLAYYYDEEYYSFYTQYYSYLAYLLDPSLPMDEQPGLDSNMTWQQSFVNAGVNMFHEISAIYAEAQAAGFEMGPEDQAMVNSMLTQLEDVAVSYGYDSPEAYLKEYYGPAADLDVYLDFFEKSYYCNLYLSSVAAAVDVSDDQLVEYYESNSSMLQENYGLEMIDLPMVHVRHILITPETTTSEDGTTGATGEAKDAAKAEAERIYAEWQAGDATEDSFAALAEANTDDPGSSTTGGLYENVYPGQMVEAFDAWCFDGARQIGDTAIVETDYGYHIMYFSGVSDEIYWRNTVAELIKSEAIANKIAELQTEHPIEVDFTKAILLTLTENTLPTEEAEATE